MMTRRFPKGIHALLCLLGIAVQTGCVEKTPPPIPKEQEAVASYPYPLRLDPKLRAKLAVVEMIPADKE